ncbi:hypothetical protein H0H93_002161, partial [Arthromyces matolae]
VHELPPQLAMRAYKFNNPDIPNQIDLPVPIHTPYTTGHYWIFGFEVPRSQVFGYYTQYRERFGRRWNPDARMPEKIISVTNLLKKITKIRSISIDLCFPNGMGPTPEDPEGPDTHIMVVTVCTSHRYSYWNRPTKEQVDHLQSFLGCGPPEWYLDSITTDFY